MADQTYYKSAYTGEQIDAALGRVVNGEIDEAADNAQKSALAAKESADAAKRSETEAGKNAALSKENADKTAADVLVVKGASDAERERVTAENNRKTAETSRETEEGKRATAEQTRTTNETTRQEAEEGRRSAEATRVSNETARGTAEADRVAKETQRVKDETARKSAETKRVNSEKDRETAEAQRKAAEEDRTAKESLRVTEEAARRTNEERRISSEAERVSRENERLASEVQRVSSETGRETAEAKREAAEKARANETSGIVARATKKADEAAASAQTAIAKAGEASTSAGAAKTSETNAKKSETAAGLSADAAEQARQAIEALGVQGVTLAAGSQVAVEKLVDASGTVTLKFSIPQGAKGDKGSMGDRGVSISSIQRTAGNGAAGTTDTYTITLSDGSTSTFAVYNGRDGEGSGDMAASVYDPAGKSSQVATEAELAALPVKRLTNSTESPVDLDTLMDHGMYVFDGVVPRVFSPTVGMNTPIDYLVVSSNAPSIVNQVFVQAVAGQILAVCRVTDDGGENWTDWMVNLCPALDFDTMRLPKECIPAFTASDVGALPSTGGALTGSLAMSGNKITGLGEPTAATDGATKQYADTKASITRSTTQPAGQRSGDYWDEILT